MAKKARNEFETLMRTLGVTKKDLVRLQELKEALLISI